VTSDFDKARWYRYEQHLIPVLHAATTVLSRGLIAVDKAPVAAKVATKIESLESIVR